MDILIPEIDRRGSEGSRLWKQNWRLTDIEIRKIINYKMEEMRILIQIGTGHKNLKR